MTNKFPVIAATLLAAHAALPVMAQNGPPEVTLAQPVDVNVINSSVPVTVQANEHVFLVTGTGSSITCPVGDLGVFMRVPGGPSVEFVVPEGKALLIKDLGIGVRELEDFPWTTKRLIVIEVNAGEPDGGGLETVYQTSFPMSSDLQEIGEAWIDRTLNAGALVGPGQRICIRGGFGFEADFRQVAMINLTKLYGVLVDHQP